MSEQHYPPGWDEARVKRLIDHYDKMTDEEWLAEDEAARKAGESHVMVLTEQSAVNGKVAPKKRRTRKKKPGLLKSERTPTKSSGKRRPKSIKTK